MAAKKKRKRAKKSSAKRSSKKSPKKKKARRGKGQIPLPILEKRLAKLSRIVAQRSK